MKVRILGTDQDQAKIILPSGKSMSHRALIAAALSEGKTILHDLGDNDDIRATADCLKKFGVNIYQEDERTIVEGRGKDLQYDKTVLDAKESGSTLRFLIPFCTLTDEALVFTGSKRLLERPLKVYEDLFELKRDNGYLKVQGKLDQKIYVVDGDISSQFISGLLFVMPLLDEDHTLMIREPFVSRSYVDLTADVLNKAGIDLEVRDNTYLVKGRQSYSLSEMRIPGDDSQAVFFAVMAMLANREVMIGNMDHDSRQGDHVLIDILARAGCKISETADGYLFKPGYLRPFFADLKDCPDLGPMLFGLAAACKGESHFINTGRLRLKESDRVACMAQELEKLGVDMYCDENSVKIIGKDRLEGDVVLDGHNDHRIVMALSILGLAVEKPLLIEGAQAVNKSYPQFFEDLIRTGVRLELYD